MGVVVLHGMRGIVVRGMIWIAICGMEGIIMRDGQRDMEGYRYVVWEGQWYTVCKGSGMWYEEEWYGKNGEIVLCGVERIAACGMRWYSDMRYEKDSGM